MGQMKLRNGRTLIPMLSKKDKTIKLRVLDAPENGGGIYVTNPKAWECDEIEVLPHPHYRLVWLVRRRQ
jgi:hypothetical protein